MAVYTLHLTSLISYLDRKLNQFRARWTSMALSAVNCWNEWTNSRTTSFQGSRRVKENAGNEVDSRRPWKLLSCTTFTQMVCLAPVLITFLIPLKKFINMKPNWPLKSLTILPNASTNYGKPFLKKSTSRSCVKSY